MSLPVSWLSLAANCWTTSGGGSSASVDNIVHICQTELRNNYELGRSPGDIWRQPNDIDLSCCLGQCYPIMTGSRAYKYPTSPSRHMSSVRWDSSSSGSRSPASPASLNFSIQEILREDFGRQQQQQQHIQSSNDAERLTDVTSSIRSEEVSFSVSRCLADSTETLSEDGKKCLKPSSYSAKISGTEKWPAWIYCTRYTDRPAGMPVRRKRSKKTLSSVNMAMSRRPRASFTPAQLCQLTSEYGASRYLTPGRRRVLAAQLAVSELQVKVWFQNQRAKNKRRTNTNKRFAVSFPSSVTSS